VNNIIIVLRNEIGVNLVRYDLGYLFKIINLGLVNYYFGIKIKKNLKKRSLRLT
jgi:hypothetical protein